MPRNCGCAGGACSCLILQGEGILIEGTGNSSEPYRVSLAPDQGVANLGPLLPAATVDGTNALVDTKYFAEATGALSLRGSSRLGVRTDFFIQNSSAFAITTLGTVFWKGGIVPPTTSARLWITLVCIDPLGFWAGEGNSIS